MKLFLPHWFQCWWLSGHWSFWVIRDRVHFGATSAEGAD